MISRMIRAGTMALIAAVMLLAMGCSVFISKPEVTQIRIHRPGDRLIEYVINLDNPIEKDLDIHLSSRYTLKLDFDWLWQVDKHPEENSALGPDLEEPQQSPWVLINYRF